MGEFDLVMIARSSPILLDRYAAAQALSEENPAGAPGALRPWLSRDRGIGTAAAQ